MKFLVAALLLALALAATTTTTTTSTATTVTPTPAKFSDLSASFTNLLLGLSQNGAAFSSFQNKLGTLASNMDSKTTAAGTVQNSVIDLFSTLENQIAN